MPDLLIEEKRNYGIDCTKAIWATDEIHDIYHACGIPHILSDADFAVEIEEYILLIEYKNANIAAARTHVKAEDEYNPFDQKKFDKIVKKFYDSFIYLYLKQKTKPIQYIFVLEYPKGNSTSRKLLRNKLKERLPFKMQQRVNSGVKLIDAVEVLDISEWNNHSVYGKYPIVEMSEQVHNGKQVR